VEALLPINKAQLLNNIEIQEQANGVSKLFWD
jgi:hypothetical protein